MAALARCLRRARIYRARARSSAGPTVWQCLIKFVPTPVAWRFRPWYTYPAMAATTEAAVRRAVLREISRRGIVAYSQHGSALGSAGAPDIIACIGGKFVAIELKSPSGRQTARQKIHQYKIEMAGGIYAVVRSAEEFVELLQKIGGTND